MTIVYSKEALKNIPNVKAAHLDKKVKNLLSLIKKAPFKTPPRYEKLVGNLSDLYSRRINIQHCLVYEVFETEQTIKIISIDRYKRLVYVI